MKKELLFWRAFGVATAIGVIFTVTTAFKDKQKNKFSEIDVERINIVEKDGSVKMVITNVDRFPSGQQKINGLPVNETRKKRAGMLFFNEEGKECGGFIYDGKKTKNGHSSGLSLTYDQYNGDQVMQLLLEDEREGENRWINNGLIFIDQPKNQDQQTMATINKELAELRQKDPKAADLKYKEYEEKGLVGTSPRMLLGKSRNGKNGLYLLDNKGMPKAVFLIDKNNKAKLEFYDEQGNVVASFPEDKK